MYAELVKTIRKQCSDMDCGNCNTCVKLKAADAIEKLEITIAGLHEAIKGLADDMPRWIHVTERLPESGQRVMAVGLHGEAMYIGTYTGGIKETAYRKAKPYKINAGGYGWRSFTWWMSLPQPPKEGETGEGN